jgi:lipoate-protein ligase A
LATAGAHRLSRTPFDVIVQPRIPPRISLAQDAHSLRVAARPGATRMGTLRVYDFTGDVLCLGRYHLAPKIPATATVQLFRRHSGGRVIPFGDGFVGITLALPHRSALVSEDPLALAPYQVMNRYVRGILEGCKLLNIPAFYPGRDFITVNRRILGLVSFEVDHAGALLFEAIIANCRDFSVLPALLDAVDPSGAVTAEMLTPEATTCMARELGTELTTEELAEAVRRGYETQFNIACAAHRPSALEEQAIEATATHEFSDARWLQRRVARTDLDYHASQRVQLGVIEAHFSLEQGRFIKDVMFTGDFIANSPAIERLERDLRLCPAEWRAIDAVVSEIFAQPGNYILGVGPARAIADTICKGLAA